ncbi:trypsin-like peptidase [Actinocrispum wychmicini]|uniref:Trypsin-like peptidase n=1 Tax=Actinocrispum wychmicini TaxID=1213861 RepID=A0A4R2ILK6_9PSEU|nr:trypsin-like peptidase [Actinocrispum wychmicini]
MSVAAPIPVNRVVAVTSRLEDGTYIFGSGYLVGGRLVLTAAHCIYRQNRSGSSTREISIRRLSDGARVSATIAVHDTHPAISQRLDIALLELDKGGISEVSPVPFANVDRRYATILSPCDAIGYPSWQTDPRNHVRNVAHIRGRIRTTDDFGAIPPRLVMLDPQLETVRVDDGIGEVNDSSLWRGISGALVFHRGFAIGVVVEHNLRQGNASLIVRPVDTIAASKEQGAQTITHLLQLADAPDLSAEWEDEFRQLGLHVWTPDDFSIGLSARGDTELASIRLGEVVNVNTLRQGRLQGLQTEFITLGKTFDRWLDAKQQKESPDRLLVFWLVGEPGAHRSKALLACLARARARTVYDAGRNLELVGKVFWQCQSRPSYHKSPLVAVDLRSKESSRPWHDIWNVLTQTRLRPFSDQCEYPRLLVAGTPAQAQDAYEELSTISEIRTFDTHGRDHQRPYSYEGTLAMASKSLSQENVFNRGLPMTTKSLVGRDEQLANLRQAWGSKHTRIVPVVAYGGTGKSALVNTFLEEMRDADYRGATKVLAWSFYSQGTRENLVSADPFVNFALSWLGDESSYIRSPTEKGIRLASLVKRHKTLLILDGLEPLQHPINSPHVGGQLTDDSMRAMLQQLARPDWMGLCVVTTRVPLTDLRRFEYDRGGQKPTVTEVKLENLDDEAGAALLRSLLRKPRASFAQLQPAVRQVDGHALAITLLGNYLREVHDGDITGRFDLRQLTIDAHEGGHARRVMDSYVTWLERGDRRDDLALLHIVGLFDRPATPDAMAAVLATATLNSGTSLLGVGSDEWNRSVAALRGMGLLNGPIPDWPGTLDAHPLVREHFRDQLQKSGNRAWNKGNTALYHYYRNQAPYQPSNSQDMNSLYAAVTHGCAAGLHQDVFDSVLEPRIWRGRRTSFSTRRLGMTGSDLVALSNYFRDRHWNEIQDRRLGARSRVLVLTNAGVRLRQLGRLLDARDCFGAVVREISSTDAGQEELEDAAYAAAQRCELLVIAGKLVAANDEDDSAMTAGRAAIEYSSRGADPYFRMHSRGALAEVHFMLGNVSQTHTLFEEARLIADARPSFLYSQGLYRYGYYLIETGHASELLAEEATDANWGTNGEDSSLLSSAIKLLVVGAGRRSLVEGSVATPALIADANAILDDSIIQLQAAGYSDYLVRGLLERAHFYRVRRRSDDYGRALQDLDNATFEAERGQMDLLYTDILLQRTACHLAFWQTMTGSERESVRPGITRGLAEAVSLVRKIEYGRRRRMVQALQLEVELKEL